MRKRLAGALAITTALACAPAGAQAADAVIALQDTGINPYHKVFRDDAARAQQAPWTYLLNYPTNAKPLNLTLTASSYAAAVKKDCETWKAVKRGQLYYVP